MTTRWNYRLAEKSTTKSIRPTYKSLRERCLVHVRFCRSFLRINENRCNLLLGYVVFQLY